MALGVVMGMSLKAGARRAQTYIGSRLSLLYQKIRRHPNAAIGGEPTAGPAPIIKHVSFSDINISIFCLILFKKFF